jgi:Flp pilus assembly pilin Flp
MRMTDLFLPYRDFARCDDGATAIEYGMIACFIFLAIVASVGALGQGVMNVLYDKIETLFG